MRAIKQETITWSAVGDTRTIIAVVSAGDGREGWMTQEQPAFAPEVVEAVQREREVELTTFGRRSGNPSTKILWAYTDGARVYLRSGGGLGRDWPQNALANGRGILHVAGMDVPVRLRHVSDLTRARATGELARAKYGPQIQVTHGDEAPTPGETATFELTPEEAAGVA
jgi:hypothetical protein